MDFGIRIIIARLGVGLGVPPIIIPGIRGTTPGVMVPPGALVGDGVRPGVSVGTGAGVIRPMAGAGTPVGVGIPDPDGDIITPTIPVTTGAGLLRVPQVRAPRVRLPVPE